MLEGRFFRYHKADAIVALCGVGHVAFLLWTFVAFASLPWWLVVVSFFVYAVMICWNLQCISHNFIHNPFFISRWLNRAFGVMETIALGMPHQLYHHYHMNHHQGNNDKKGSDGTTRDWSSIFRHGHDDQPEGFWRYVLLSFFRVEVGPVLQVAIKHGFANTMQVIVESLALAAFWLVMLYFNWQYFVAFYLPSFFLGWVLSYAEGYLEHYGAKPDNAYADSVSSYYWPYNFLWFNNGYHQEHHWDPKRHWTQMTVLHSEIRSQLNANGTRILTGPHITGLIEDWFKGNPTPPPPSSTGDEQQRRAA